MTRGNPKTLTEVIIKNHLRELLEANIMRSPERIARITHLIQELWMDKYTDMRYFQLINFLSFEYSRRNNNKGRLTLTQKEYVGAHILEQDYAIIDLFHLEDDVVEKFLCDLANEK